MPIRSASVKKAAEDYIARGFQVVPLEPGTKGVQIKDWINLVFKAEDFKEDDNIGIRSVNGLVDIDCDSPEVVFMAPTFLPGTNAIYGRYSKPHAHWLYRSRFEKTVALKDIGAKDTAKAMLIEIRVNHQSMAPPSIHPDGELISWEGIFGTPTEVDPKELHRAVQLTASAALIARYYNGPGNRHDWSLAMAGTMMQLGITEEEANKIFSKAGEWAHDSDIKNRLGTIRSTYSRTSDDPIKAFKDLKELMPEGTVFIQSLSRIWGTASSAFLVNDKGLIFPNNQENVKRALKKMEVQLFFNAFEQKPHIIYNGYEGELEDPIRNRLWLEIDRLFHFRPTPEFFDVVIQDIAYANQVHPVRDYLKSLTWDKTDRLDTWLIRSAKAADTPYNRAVSSITLIAAVRRVMHPGCKFDELLVLESGQGQNKSTVLRLLCPDESWFSDDLPLNVDAKQIIERTTGKWVIEAAELSGMRSSQTEHLKAMLSRQVDGPVRLAYARLPKSQPRQFIVVGTTNSHMYLDDPTGNRRFWPVRIENADIKMLRQERDQLWAEATARENAGESIRLPEGLYAMAEIQQERRRNEHPWENILIPLFGEGIQRVTPDEVWEALNIPISQRTMYHQKQLNQIMQQMGFRKITIRPTGKPPVKGWGRGEWGVKLKVPVGAPLPLGEENAEDEENS